VERASSQHTPRVDEQLKEETAPLTHSAPVEGHVRDDLQQEGTPGHPGNRPDGRRAPADMDGDEVDLRAALAASLRPSSFPADRERLLLVARDEQAPDEVVSLLEQLPADITWSRVEGVWEAAGGRHEPQWRHS
jgi:hypothetical protein